MWALALIAAAPGPTALCDPAPNASASAITLDLSKPFDTRSPWRLVVTQGPATEDYGGDPAPGRLDLCLRRGPVGPCVREPVSAEPPSAAGSSVDWGPHYLRTAKTVYPHDGRRGPLLELVTASVHAGDGGQAVVTQLLKYDRRRDAFQRIYFHATGTNNNEEVRFVAGGPLDGSVIAAEPTADAPYGYWVTVDRLTPARTYQRVLRYRSATRYNDGNPLPVIDSEMPNIERRLGLWKPGQPMPLPTGAKCPTPRLERTELWCGAGDRPRA